MIMKYTKLDVKQGKLLDFYVRAESNDSKEKYNLNKRLIALVLHKGLNQENRVYSWTKKNGLVKISKRVFSTAFDILDHETIYIGVKQYDKEYNFDFWDSIKKVQVYVN